MSSSPAEMRDYGAQYLGVLRGTGTLASRDEVIAPIDYEFDGYLMWPGEVVAAG